MQPFQGKLPQCTSRLKTLDGMPIGYYLSSSRMSEYIVIDEAGATETVNARETQVVKALCALTNGGPDYVFDTVGSQSRSRKRY